YKPKTSVSTDALEEVSQASANHFPVGTKIAVNYHRSSRQVWSRSGLPDHTMSNFLPVKVVVYIVMITTTVLGLSTIRDGLTSVLMHMPALMARLKPCLASGLT
ncbi:hypothetical protein BGZ81_000996, partial [Podila clonocystis]